MPSVDKIIEEYKNKIDKANYYLPYAQDELERYFYMPLRKFIRYIGNLPASEAHHHSCEYGLLTHTLDVIRIALTDTSLEICTPCATLFVPASPTLIVSRFGGRRGMIFRSILRGSGHARGRFVGYPKAAMGARDPMLGPPGMASGSQLKRCRYHENHSSKSANTLVGINE